MITLNQDISFSAVVEHGEKRGRALGFPTANLTLPKGIDLDVGVYAVKASLDNGVTFLKGAASYGYNPTFGNEKRSFEVHILDFDEDIYDKFLLVTVVEFIRGEEAFDSLDALKMKIQEDCDYARDALNKKIIDKIKVV